MTRNNTYFSRSSSQQQQSVSQFKIKKKNDLIILLDVDFIYKVRELSLLLINPRRVS